MKKYLFLMLAFMCLFIVGCGNNNNDNVINNFTNNMNGIKNYELNGKLAVVNNDDVFNYDVSVSYKDKDYYRVVLKNLSNNHEQIILRNDDGVYVVTPSLNKSFKFQSDWPYNNSQTYIIKNIINDINNDSMSSVTENNNSYVITSNVNFPNNNKLKKQKVTINKNLDLEKVEILNEEDINMMTFVVDNINYKPIYSEDFFEINSIINNANSSQDNPSEQTDTTSTLDDIIYPLYIPTGTVLTNEEKVSKTDGERIILTFGGDKPFTLVEETTNKEKEFTVVPTYGEPFLLIDTVAALSDNSINWVSNGVEYYIVSDVLAQNELIEVAKSVNVIGVLK